MDLLQTLNPEHEPGRNDEIRSIHDHLTKLLNSKKFLLPHLPEFGLTDLSAHEGKQDILSILKNEIEQVIENYEPRLSDIEVTPSEINFKEKRDFIALLNIKARLLEDPDASELSFQYHISLDGRIHSLD